MDCETQKGRVGHPSGQWFWSVFFFIVHVSKLNACGPLPPFLPPSHIWRAHTTMRVRYCQYNNASTAMLVQGDRRVVLDLLTKIFNAWKENPAVPTFQRGKSVMLQKILDTWQTFHITIATEIRRNFFACCLCVA